MKWLPAFARYFLLLTPNNINNANGHAKHLTCSNFKSMQPGNLIIPMCLHDNNTVCLSSLSSLRVINITDSKGRSYFDQSELIPGHTIFVSLTNSAPCQFVLGISSPGKFMPDPSKSIYPMDTCDNSRVWSNVSLSTATIVLPNTTNVTISANWAEKQTQVSVAKSITLLRDVKQRSQRPTIAPATYKPTNKSSHPTQPTLKPSSVPTISYFPTIQPSTAIPSVSIVPSLIPSTWSPSSPSLKPSWKSWTSFPHTFSPVLNPPTTTLTTSLPSSLTRKPSIVSTPPPTVPTKATTIDTSSTSSSSNTTIVMSVAGAIFVTCFCCYFFTIRSKKKKRSVSFEMESWESDPDRLAQRDTPDSPSLLARAHAEEAARLRSERSNLLGGDEEDEEDEISYNPIQPKRGSKRTNG